MNSRAYYEKYWLQEAPPPDHDPTVKYPQTSCGTVGLRTEVPPTILDAGCGSGGFLDFFVGFHLLHFEGFGRMWPLYKSSFVVASKPV